MRRILLAGLALALTACGTQKPAAAPTTAPASSNAAAAVTPAASSTAGKGASQQDGRPSVAASEPVALPSSAPDHVEGTTKAPLQVEIGSTCVVRGTAQTMTIRSTPGLQFSWATVYADGKTHQEYNGWGAGNIPPSGFIGPISWSIPVTAPLGDVRSDVAVAGRMNRTDFTAFGHAYYRVAQSC